MYGRILVPLDGSAFAEAALPLAKALSKKTGAELRLVSVLEPIPSFALESWEAAASKWLEDYLTGAAERASDPSGGPVSTALLRGHVVEALVEEVKSQTADLVVMATHGRGPLSRAWIGSAADGVARHVDTPVILVRPREDAGDDPGPSDFQKVLVPLDGLDLSESALEHAVEFGALFDAAYHLTRVVSFPLEVSSPYLPHTVQMNAEVLSEAKEQGAEYLEEHAARMRKRGLEVTTSVVVDTQAGNGILTEGEEVGSDLIAMATRGRTGVGRLVLGSAADKVVRGTHGPVLLYKPPRRDT